MDENLKDTLKSLLTKLSAVRVTLTDEEQSLLDQLILSSKEEVQAHYKAFAPDEAKAYGADEARAMHLQYKPDEAKAMEADEARAMHLQYKPDEAKAMGADEAKAMHLQYKPDEAKALGAEEAYAQRLLKPVEAKALGTDEVSAHSLPTSALNKPAFPNPVWVKIVYDPMMECYKVI